MVNIIQFTAIQYQKLEISKLTNNYIYQYDQLVIIKHLAQKFAIIKKQAEEYNNLNPDNKIKINGLRYLEKNQLTPILDEFLERYNPKILPVEIDNIYKLKRVILEKINPIYNNINTIAEKQLMIDIILFKKCREHLKNSIELDKIMYSVYDLNKICSKFDKNYIKIDIENFKRAYKLLKTSWTSKH